MLDINLQHQILTDVLAQTEATLSNPNLMLADMGEYLVSSHQERFRTSTAPDGSRWQANSQTTYLSILGSQHTDGNGQLNSRGINRVASKRPLVGSGNLMNSIHYQISGDVLLVGSNLEYAVTHQFGATIKAKNKKSLSWKIGDVSVFVKQVVIPARVFLGVSAADEAELQAIVQNHLFE